MPAHSSRFDPSVRVHPRVRQSAPTSHFVEFYYDDSSLITSIATFVSMGLTEGDAAIVVADPAHREALELELDRTIDLRAARERGQYASFDAEETMSRFMKDGVADRVRFDRVFEEITKQVAVHGGNLRIFGEMVALLWAQGNVAGALALEDLWNEAAKRYPFQLFCAYPANVFEKSNQALSSICDGHTHILVPGPETP